MKCTRYGSVRAYAVKVDRLIRTPLMGGCRYTGTGWWRVWSPWHTRHLLPRCYPDQAEAERAAHEENRLHESVSVARDTGTPWL